MVGAHLKKEQKLWLLAVLLVVGSLLAAFRAPSVLLFPFLLFLVFAIFLLATFSTTNNAARWHVKFSIIVVATGFSALPAVLLFTSLFDAFSDMFLASTVGITYFLVMSLFICFALGRYDHRER